MDASKLIDGLTYVRDVLNTLPVTGIEDCQKIINSVTNINITINELQTKQTAPVAVRESKEK